VRIVAGISVRVNAHVLVKQLAQGTADNDSANRQERGKAYGVHVYSTIEIFHDLFDTLFQISPSESMTIFSFRETDPGWTNSQKLTSAPNLLYWVSLVAL
jgi:hypothetical protein